MLREEPSASSAASATFAASSLDQLLAAGHTLTYGADGASPSPTPTPLTDAPPPPPPPASSSASASASAHGPAPDAPTHGRDDASARAAERAGDEASAADGVLPSTLPPQHDADPLFWQKALYGEAGMPSAVESLPRRARRGRGVHARIDDSDSERDQPSP